MRCARTCSAISVIALATLHAGCRPTCPSVDRAPIPAGQTAVFAVLARDVTRTQITLLDATGAPITWPSPDDATRTTDVWLDATNTWDNIQSTDGIGLEPLLSWNPLPSALAPALTLFVEGGGRAIARFPLDGSPPIETATERALVGLEEAGTGGQVLDLVVDSEPGIETVFYALRSRGMTAAEPTGEPGVAFGDDILVIDPALDPELGGLVVDSISLTAAGDGTPAAPQRMVSALGYLFIGLDRFEPATTERAARVGPGAIAIVDPAERRLASVFEIPDPMFTRCGQITQSVEPSPDPDVVFLLVGCSGSGADLLERQQSAGVFRLRVERDPTVPDRDPTIRIEESWLSTNEYGLIPSRGLVSLPGNAFAVVSEGDLEEPRDDFLFVVDLDAEEQPVQRVARGVLVAEEISGLGTGAFLPDETVPESGLLVWPVARQGILRARVSSDGGNVTIDEQDRVELCNPLVVQQVRLLSQP